MSPIYLLIAFYIGGVVSHLISFFKNLHDTNFFRDIKFDTLTLEARIEWYMRVIWRGLTWFVRVF